MAVLISTATGLFSAASTWNLVDGASYLDTEANYTTLGTSYAASQTFVPGAITVNALAVKVQTRASSPSGTLTIALENTTDGGYVAEVSIAVSSIAAGAVSRGWYVLALPSSVTLLAGKNYRLAAKTSVSAQVGLYRSSTTSDWARMLRTTTTQAPAAGDQLHVCGVAEGAAVEVTMDNTSSVASFGPTVSGGPPQGMTVGAGGTLTVGTAAATNYYLRWKGVLAVYAGGTLNVGTAETRMPASSTASLHMDAVVAGDSGIEILNGTFNAHGAERTNVITTLTQSVGGWCQVNGTAVTAQEGSQPFTGLTGTITIGATNYTIASVTDATHLTLTGSAGTVAAATWRHSASAHVIQVQSTAGWAAGDVLCFAPSIAGQDERRTIQSVDSATQVTLTAPLSFMHYSSGHLLAHVGLLTRNVRVFGGVAYGYVYSAQLSTVSWSHAAFYSLGASGATKNGVVLAHREGTFAADYCAFYDFYRGSGGCGVGFNNGTDLLKSTIRITFSVFYVQYVGVGEQSVASPNTYPRVITDNLFVACSSAGQRIFGFSNTQTERNVYAGCNQALLMPSEAQSGTLSDCICYAGTTGGLLATSSWNSWSQTVGLWKCSVYGCPTAFSQAIYSQPYLYVTEGTYVDVAKVFTLGPDANYVGPIVLERVEAYKLPFSTFSYESFFSQATGQMQVQVYNGTFGGAVPGRRYAPSRAWLDYGEACGGRLDLLACTFDPATQLVSKASPSTNTTLSESQLRLTSHWHNRSGTDSREYNWNGTVLSDPVIFGETGSRSVRLCPNPGAALTGAAFWVAVEAGKSLTVTVKTRESVAADGQAYDGDRPALYVARNDVAGIREETQMATATAAGSGAFEILSGVVGPVSQNTVVSCYVRAGGTAYTQGWVNVADIRYERDVNTTGFDFWSAEGQLLVSNAAGTVSTGGGGDGGGGGSSWTFAN